MSSIYGISLVDGIELVGPRFLEDIGANSTVDETRENMTQILRDSMRVYGSLFAFGLVIYCYLRKRIPRTFAVRQWIPEHKTPLAQNQFGYVSWIWKVYSFSEDDLLATISLDALCFLRVLNMGFRLSCF
jgi:Late exocytosis, associated with Golgi transport